MFPPDFHSPFAPAPAYLINTRAAPARSRLPARVYVKQQDFLRRTILVFDFFDILHIIIYRLSNKSLAEMPLTGRRAGNCSSFFNVVSLSTPCKRCDVRPENHRKK